MKTFKYLNSKVPFIWLVTMMGLTISYPSPIVAWDQRIGAQFVSDLLCMVVCCFVFIYLRKHETKIGFLEYVIGFVFSSLLNFTWSLSAGETQRNLPGLVYLHGMNLLLSLFSIFSWTILIAGILKTAIVFFSKVDIQKFNKLCHLTKGRIALILVCSWLLELITFLPGQISWDAAKQFCEFEGRHISAASFTYVPTNHNPWFVTLIFGHIFNIGNKIAGPNFGVLLIVFMQLIVSCLIYTHCIDYLLKKCGSIFGITALILIASPVVGAYITTIDKSTLYYAFCVWYVVEYLKLFDSDEINNKPYQIFSYSIASVLFGFFRNDSIYIVIISTTIYILYACFKKRDVITPFLSIIVVVLIFSGWHVYLSHKRVVPSAISEAITLPTRQVSYVYLHNNKDLSNNDRKTINKVTPLKKIEKNMNINQGDDLKNLFPVNTFLNSTYLMKQVSIGHKTTKLTAVERKNIKAYVKLWVKLGISYPKTYLNVFFAANRSWINPFLPQQVHDYVFINFPDRIPNFVEPSWVNGYHYLLPLKIRNKVALLFYLLLAFPPVAIFINVAMPFVIALYSFYEVLRKKNGNLFLKLIPFYGLVALSFLTPVAGYSRYSIGMTLLIPFVLFVVYNCNYRPFTRKEGTEIWTK